MNTGQNEYKSRIIILNEIVPTKRKKIMWQERSANVLIVDDKPENLDLLCHALEPEGYNILKMMM